MRPSRRRSPTAPDRGSAGAATGPRGSDGFPPAAGVPHRRGRRDAEHDVHSGGRHTAPGAQLAEHTRRTLLDGFSDAFTRADPGALVNLLRADVELEMPPQPTWFTGREAVLGFLAARVLRRPGQWRALPAGAGFARGKPAAASHRGSRRLLRGSDR